MNPLSITIYSHRKYGEPALKKPKELSGISQDNSVYFEAKCKCPIFITDTPDIWIKHRDFFSPMFRPSDPADNDKPLYYILKKYFNKEKQNKFIYSNCWGEVVLRNEAWIRINNALTYDLWLSKRGFYDTDEWMHTFWFDCRRALADSLGENWMDISLEWERFFESIYHVTKKYQHDKNDDC